MNGDERARLDDELLARLAACVGPVRSVEVDPVEQARLTVRLLEAAPSTEALARARLAVAVDRRRRELVAALEEERRRELRDLGAAFRSQDELLLEDWLRQ